MIGLNGQLKYGAVWGRVKDESHFWLEYSANDQSGKADRSKGVRGLGGGAGVRGSGGRQ